MLTTRKKFVYHHGKYSKNTTVKVCMARNLGHRVSCDLHSGYHAMILTAGFLGYSGLILFGKIERSNTTMFMVK